MMTNPNSMESLLNDAKLKLKSQRDAIAFAHAKIQAAETHSKSIQEAKELVSTQFNSAYTELHEAIQPELQHFKEQAHLEIVLEKYKHALIEYYKAKVTRPGLGLSDSRRACIRTLTTLLFDRNPTIEPGAQSPSAEAYNLNCTINQSKLESLDAFLSKEKDFLNKKNYLNDKQKRKLAVAFKLIANTAEREDLDQSIDSVGSDSNDQIGDDDNVKERTVAKRIMHEFATAKAFKSRSVHKSKFISFLSTAKKEADQAIAAFNQEIKNLLEKLSKPVLTDAFNENENFTDDITRLGRLGFLSPDEREKMEHTLTTLPRQLQAFYANTASAHLTLIDRDGDDYDEGENNDFIITQGHEVDLYHAIMALQIDSSIAEAAIAEGPIANNRLSVANNMHAAMPVLNKQLKPIELRINEGAEDEQSKQINPLTLSYEAERLNEQLANAENTLLSLFKKQALVAIARYLHHRNDEEHKHWWRNANTGVNRAKDFMKTLLEKDSYKAACEYVLNYLDTGKVHEDDNWFQAHIRLRNGSFMTYLLQELFAEGGVLQAATNNNDQAESIDFAQLANSASEKFNPRFAPSPQANQENPAIQNGFNWDVFNGLGANTLDQWLDNNADSLVSRTEYRPQQENNAEQQPESISDMIAKPQRLPFYKSAYFFKQPEDRRLAREAAVEMLKENKAIFSAPGAA